MPTIKVNHNNEIRRFAVSSHSTWSELDSTLRAIFSIPPSDDIVLSYTDEDGDEVMLSTDLELKDVLNQNIPEGGSVKFNLRRTARPTESESGEDDGVIIPDDNSSFVDSMYEGISGPGIVINNKAVEDDISSCDEDYENVEAADKKSDMETKSNEEDDRENSAESIPLLYSPPQSETETFSNEEKYKSRDTGIPSTSFSPSPQSFTNSNDTLGDLTQQLQTLVNQFQEFFNNNPQLMESANKLINDVMDSVKGDIETFEREQQRAVPIINGIFRNIGHRLFSSHEENNDANGSTTDNMAYNTSHTPPMHFAYQNQNGDMACGRGFYAPGYGFSRTEGYSEKAKFFADTDESSEKNDERSFDGIERTDNENIELANTDDTTTFPITDPVPKPNEQDFALAPPDLLSDIRLLREMGFTQPTRELVNLFRRNDNLVDRVITILLEGSGMND